VRTRAQLGARVKAAALGAPDELQHMAHWHSTLEHGRGAYLMRFATFKALSLGPLTMAANSRRQGVLHPVEMLHVYL
jgi:hypothetical protein